jgi:hypothetical protein
MQIYVRTRGLTKDYQFLGEAPEDFWWRAYRPVTDIERPTILLRSNGESWQAYVAGIRSQRVDSTKTVIQFNLAMAGHCGHTADNALMLTVLTQAAAGLPPEPTLLIPGEPLDAVLPADIVERMLERPGQETATEAEKAVRAAYTPMAGRGAGAALPDADPAGAQRAGADVADAHPAGEAPSAGGDWMGGAASAEALGAFGALVARLLDGGQAGLAAALNLIEAEADLEDLPDTGGVRGVLAARPGPHLGMAVRPLGKGLPPLLAGEGKSAEPGHRRRLWRMRQGTLILAGISGVIVLAAVLISVLALT